MAAVASRMPGSSHFEFSGAGAAPGLEIWRIEKMTPVPWPRERYGQFHVGDSYICLHTKGREHSSTLQWDIHFWLGSETSHDEKGVAAYKSVELDDSLGGTPVQYRETQAHESELFLAMLKKHCGMAVVEYLPGGVDSALVAVDDPLGAAFKPRLLRLKGAHRVRAEQVQPVAASSMNSGDVFILDLGRTIFQWNGGGASRKEKATALELSSKLRGERGGGSSVRVVLCEEGQEPYEFWEAMPGGKQPVPAADAPGMLADGAAERAAKEAIRLYRVTDAGGRLAMHAEGGYPLRKDMLDTNDCFIVNVGDRLFVWIGRRATKQEKKNAMLFAQDFLAQHSMPDWTPVERVLEGGETADFKQAFDHFDPPPSPADFSAAVGQTRGRGVAKTPAQQAIDVGALHAATAREDAIAQMVDDARGKVDVWRIESFDKVPWPETLFGQFFGGDSFLVLYTYVPAGRSAQEYILYIWQGRESSVDEKGASALLAVALDDEYGGKPVQVRVEQGKEPDHMVMLFQGKMVIHKGGKASGFKNRAAEDTYDTDGVSLFHVRGNGTRATTRAVQVEEEARQLNSGDAFILLTPGQMWVWYGGGASSEERSIAKSTAMSMVQDRDLAELEEGREPAAFWEALAGGKQPYAQWSTAEPPKQPRLFHCTNFGGTFRVAELVDYSQDDLDPDDICLLDTYAELYVWVGDGANEEEKRGSAEVARRYIHGAPDGRDPACPIITVAQGSEPLMFTCHFLGWDPVAAAAFEDPYIKKMEALGQAAAAFTRPSPSAAELVPKLGLEGVAPESEVQQMIVAFEYYDVDGGGFMDQTEFRKLAPHLQEQGLVRAAGRGTQAERAADMAEAFGSIDRDNSGHIDLEEFIGWWFRDKLSLKAKREAKRRAPLDARDVGEIKARLGLRSVPDSKIQAMKLAFAKHDADGSGLLSTDEFRRLAPELGVNLTPAGLRKAFEHLDADGSGEIEFEEFLGWHFAPQAETVLTVAQRRELVRAKGAAARAKAADVDGVMDNVMEHARAAFRRYDADASGTISPAEFGALCYDMGYALPAEDRPLVLQLLDADGDGEVSFREFFRWWKEHRERFFVTSYTEDVTAAIYYFKKFDHDLSGSLDMREYSMMCSEMGWDTTDIHDSIRYLDADGDGVVSFNEFLTWYTDDGMVNNLIRCYDVDRNGKLNLGEFTEMCKAWKLDPAKAALILRKFDMDGDGELGHADLRGLMRKVDRAK